MAHADLAPLNLAVMHLLHRIIHALLVRKHNKAKAAGAARGLINHDLRISGAKLAEGCRHTQEERRQLGHS